MLNVAHVINYVKWRPIVTKFGTLIDNTSRTGLYDCHDFMRNINFGIGILHVKRQILTYFCEIISLLAQVFIVSFDRAYKEESTKNIENYLWLSFCDMTVPSKSNVPSLWPWPLTYEGQLFCIYPQRSHLHKNRTRNLLTICMSPPNGDCGEEHGLVSAMNCYLSSD